MPVFIYWLGSKNHDLNNRLLPRKSKYTSLFNFDFVEIEAYDLSELTEEEIAAYINSHIGAWLIDASLLTSKWIFFFKYKYDKIG